MPAIAIHDWTELASRAGEGLEISLLWNRSSDRVRVTVWDARFEERLDLDVAKAEALTAYHHPFAYAAAQAAAGGPRLGTARTPAAMHLQS